LSLQDVLRIKLAKRVKNSSVTISHNDAGFSEVTVAADWGHKDSPADRQQLVYEILSDVADETLLAQISAINCVDRS